MQITKKHVKNKFFNIFTRKTTESGFKYLEGEDISGFKNAIAPAIFDEGPTYIRLGENYVRTLAVIDWPYKVRGNWLSKLYRFKGNVTFSLHMQPERSEKLQQEISASIQELNSRRYPVNSEPSPLRKKELDAQIESANQVLDNLTNSQNNSMYFAHLYIHLTASSLEELDHLTNKIVTVLWAVGLKSSAPFDRMKHAFNSVLPTLQNDLPEWTAQNMDIEAASSLMPFDESEIFEEDGIIKGENLTTGSSLVMINQHNLKNHNEFVLGMAGAGKSFYMKRDMLRYFKEGVRLFVIDPEGEYSYMIKKIGGQVIKLSPMSNTVINPLEILHPDIDMVEGFKDYQKAEEENDLDDENEVQSTSLLHQKLSRLKIFFRQIKKNLSDLEGALIEKYLIKTYKENKVNGEEKSITWFTDFRKLKSTDYPTLSDFYKKIEESNDDRLSDFLAILETFVTGSNSLMFNGHTNVNLYADAVSFDLKELQEEADSQAAAMFNVITFLWDEITRDKKSWKRLYIDECHVLSDPQNPRAMKFVFNIFKRIRKYLGGAVAATQQLADFLSATEGHKNYGKAIIGNSMSKLFLSMEESDIEDIQKHSIARLSEKEKLILSSDKRGEGIFIAGKRRTHIQIEYTKKELEWIDPKAYRAIFGGVAS